MFAVPFDKGPNLQWGIAVHFTARSVDLNVFGEPSRVSGRLGTSPHQPAAPFVSSYAARGIAASTGRLRGSARRLCRATPRGISLFA